MKRLVTVHNLTFFHLSVKRLVTNRTKTGTLLYGGVPVNEYAIGGMRYKKRKSNKYFNEILLYVVSK